MLAITLAVTVLATVLAPVRDGAFVGTFVAADGTSLVVRADDGDQVTFLVDRETDMPAGFVAGTRVLVRFEVLEDRRYRAASVSPPRIPLEADVRHTLASGPDPEPGPAKASKSASVEDQPAPPLALASEADTTPSSQPEGQTRDDKPPAHFLEAGWGTATVLLLAGSALLIRGLRGHGTRTPIGLGGRGGVRGPLVHL